MTTNLECERRHAAPATSLVRDAGACRALREPGVPSQETEEEPHHGGG